MAHSSLLSWLSGPSSRRAIRRWLGGAALCCACAAGCASPQVASSSPLTPFPNAPPSHAATVADHVPPGHPVAAAVDTSPQNSGVVQLRYGQLKEQQGDPGAARASYEKALQTNPSLVEAHVGLARLDLAVDRKADAEAHLRDAVRIQPRSPFALAALGQFYGDQGRWDDALEFYAQAMNAAPDDKRYTFQMAVALAKSGRVEQAMPLFTRSVGEAAGHHNVAVICHEQGDLTGAEHHAQLALAKDPDLAASQELLETLRGGDKNLADGREATSGPAIRPGPSTADPPVAARSKVLPVGSATLSKSESISPRETAGGIRITPGKPQKPLEPAIARNENWSTRSAPETSDGPWQRMPTAPRNPLEKKPSMGEPSQWEQLQNQRSSSSLN